MLKTTLLLLIFCVAPIAAADEPPAPTPAPAPDPKPLAASQSEAPATQGPFAEAIDYAQQGRLAVSKLEPRRAAP